MTDKNMQSLAAGTVLNGKWIILEFIAKGGMGEIYRAHQLNLKRDVAIKIVSKEWLQDIEEDEEEMENAFRRFRQEVLTMAQIRHPNVIQIYDFDKATVKSGEDEIEIEYIALEYIPGRTLKDTMREEGFYPEEDTMARWLEKTFIPMLEGVEAVHRAGILHRDLKPANVLMDGDIPKIADFGLARSCKLESMTCSLEIKGSPAYMAPEQFIDFKGTDNRTDIYSLGKILFEAADGKIPEKSIPFKQARLKKAETPFYEKIDRIIGKATDEKPENRYQDILEFKNDVLEALELFRTQPADGIKQHSQSGILLSRPRQIALGILGVLLVAALSFWAWHSIREHFLKAPAASENRRLEYTSGDPSYVTYPAGVPREVSTPDGTKLALVPGGEFMLPPTVAGGTGIKVKVDAFYMDATPVTNQQFVDFLNAIRTDLVVSSGAVKKGEQIYLYLGEATQGYEPIIFKDGVFRVKHSGHSACPVVRVTGYGARAYAEFYHRSLPSVSQWLWAASEARGSFPQSLFKPLKQPTPVMLMPENALGIRGLEIHFGNWVINDTPNVDTAQGKRSNGLAIIGGGEAGRGVNNKIPAPVIRQPWEAFEEVGFRCARVI